MKPSRSAVKPGRAAPIAWNAMRDENTSWKGLCANSAPHSMSMRVATCRPLRSRR
jgi:hypothetical protein